MLFFPRKWSIVFTRWRCVHPVMDPAVPAWRDCRGFGVAIIDHPPAFAAFGIKRPLIVDVAELIFADLRTLAPGEKTRTQRLSIPPCEKLSQEGFHCSPD